jgi:hypothetical protein
MKNHPHRTLSEIDRTERAMRATVNLTPQKNKHPVELVLTLVEERAKPLALLLEMKHYQR